MNRLLLVAVLAAFCTTLLPSCATVIVAAPPNSNTKLLTELEPAPSKVVVTNWYFLWGLVPVSTISISDLIAKYQLKNIRVKTYIGFLDWLTIAVTDGIIYTNTIEIEGNTR
jgi:hypothetical protein